MSKSINFSLPQERDIFAPKIWAFVKAVFLSLYGLLVRVRVVGREHLVLPMRSGFVVAANHLTGADSIVIQVGLKTRVFFLAAARWFHSRFGGFWMRNLCDTMPVVSGKGVENVPTLRQSVRMLKAGGVVGVYPEGELNRTGGINRLHYGCAWLAVRANVPLVPVYVAGLKPGPVQNTRPGLKEFWEGFFSVVGNILNRNIVVAIGEPILPREDQPRTAEELRRELNRIHRQLGEQFIRLRAVVDRQRN
ncbi:MAG: lysophospholipid acyltransferase family protein [bacterium]